MHLTSKVLITYLVFISCRVFQVSLHMCSFDSVFMVGHFRYVQVSLYVIYTGKTSS